MLFRYLLVATLILGFVSPTHGASPYFFIPAERSQAPQRDIEVPVLLYHYVRPYPPGDKLGASLSVPPEQFRRQLEFLLQSGYSPISLEQFLGALQGRSILPANPVLITFDDGTADFASAAFPILQSYGIPATVFIVPGFLGTKNYLSWEQLRTLSVSPLITVGAHGLNHVSFPSLQRTIADRQLALSRNMLRAATGQPVRAVAYPNGAFSGATLDGASSAGYDLGFTTLRGTRHTLRDRLKIPRVRAGGSVRSLAQVLNRSTIVNQTTTRHRETVAQR